MNEIYDILIVGAGPAGAFAAVLLAKQGRSVVLVDVADFPATDHCGGWVNGRVDDYLKAAGVRTRGLMGGGLTSLTFHNADFSKSTATRFDNVVGHLVNRTSFDQALIDAAGAAGVACHRAGTVAEIIPHEESIALRVDDDTILEGRVLIAADGSGPLIVGQLGIAKPSVHDIFWRVQTEATTAAKSRTRKRCEISVALGVGTARGFGYVFAKNGSVVTGLSSPGDREHVLDGFEKFWTAAVRAGLIPEELTPPTRNLTCHPTPAGGALDIESHVGKHTIVIGDAGGFLSAVSNETVYPSMWSAEIAAEVVNEALDGPNIQDGLAQFETRWRTTMADYLRMPNTDVQFLWPLVFANQQMADKMAAAFLTGENI